MQATQTARPAKASTDKPAKATKAPKPTPTVYIPALQPGEHYAGIVLDTDGKPTHHLVLMAARPDGELPWQAAMDWAASIGGALPTRQEQSLLFANCKPRLAPEWHWSCETYEGNASYAWLCYFRDGRILSTLKSYEGSAVAVRRLVIQSFNTFDAGAQ